MLPLQAQEMIGTPIIRRIAMFRFALIALAGFILIAASLVPDDAFARRGVKKCDVVVAQRHVRRSVVETHP